MNIKSAFFVSSLLMLNGLSFGQLSKVSGSINDIQAVNESTFIAVGDGGCIRKTGDGGRSWRLIKPVVLTNIYAITKASDLVYYACGSEGVIKSEDCGENWAFLGDPTFNWDEDIYFLDELNGYTLSGQGYISKTNDGGKTWTECARPLYLSGTGMGYFTQIYFLDKRTGYAVYTDNINLESSELYRTTNGGESWSIYREGYRFIMSPENGTLYSIKGYNVISKSSNGGKSWIEFELGIDDILNGLCFMDSQRGYAITLFGSIYYTQDGAVTWELVESYSNTLYALASFGNSENAIAVGSNANILVSNNKGNDWELRCLGPPKNLETTCSFFISENVGFVFCKGLMFKTLDAGATWYCIQLNFDEYILDCYFVDEQIGYIFTDDALYKTQNSGINWDKLSFYDINLTGVYFINKDTGFVYGDWGLLYKTTNGGVNWTKKAFPNDRLDGIRSMQFVNESIGYTVGHENALC